MKFFALFLAVCVLVAPSCPPTDFPPPNYDIEREVAFERYTAESDLVFLQNAPTPKGDSAYVVAMPEGKVVGRIDGPDRGSFLRAGAVAYYAVTHYRGSPPQRLLFGLDPATGRRRARIELPLSPALRSPEPGWRYGGLVATRDGDIVIAYPTADGRVVVRRYDGTSGGIEREQQHPATSERLHVLRLAALADDAIVLSWTAIRADGARSQEMLILGPELAERARLSSANNALPADAICDPVLRPISSGWVTVCLGDRGSHALFLDRSFALPNRLSLGDRPIAWTVVDGRPIVLSASLSVEDIDPARRPLEASVPRRDSGSLPRGGVNRAWPSEQETRPRDRMPMMPTAGLPPLQLAHDGRTFFALSFVGDGRLISRIDARSGATVSASTIPSVILDVALSPSGAVLYVLVRDDRGASLLGLDPATLAVRSRSGPLPTEPPPIAIAFVTSP